jgi:hypothetical protein
MKLSYFDPDGMSARCQADVWTVRCLDLTCWHTAKSAAHLFNQPHLFLVLVLASHRIFKLPNGQRSQRRLMIAPAAVWCNAC